MAFAGKDVKRVEPVEVCNRSSLAHTVESALNSCDSGLDKSEIARCHMLSRLFRNASVYESTEVYHKAIDDLTLL